ncbi:hypothetical protein L1987_56997 [Smallanthus sonchifolius]|uniref:Uncharacterized protein n=1 Tax=Smallanthus sonchifolius TaxID=185202 RepID=A0ACB9DBL8_9ASTR|nr:hypothetical protein L1987_56997 [Smallanthus sonchifolius]
MLDTPRRSCLQTVFDQFPEFEQIISQKINTEFVLYELQLRLMTIALNEEKYKGVTVVERTDNGEGTCLLLLQINLKQTDMPDDLILQFYHNGMIDYIELELKTEGIINLFGEKFVIATGNISTHIFPPYIGCKIFSSFPFANDHTYRPTGKRMFISHKLSTKDYLKRLVIQTEIQLSELYWVDNLTILASEKPESNSQRKDTTQFITQNQKTPTLPPGFH